MVAPDRTTFAERIRSGDRDLMAWIESRCRRVAAPQFSAWAWDWIRDDFVADLFAQLALAARRTDFELRSDAGAYVDTSVRNLCRRYFADIARMRAHSSIAPGGEPPPISVPGSLAGVSAALEVRDALDHLSPECRRLMVEKYITGRSLAEIGRELGVPEKTARSRLHQCRKKLREIWAR